MDTPEEHEKKYRAKIPHGLADAFGKYSLPKELAGMDDEQLGKWHEAEVKKDPESGECILATQEWQRRLTTRQIEATIRTASDQTRSVIKTTRWMVIATIIASLLGAVVVALVTPFGQAFHDWCLGLFQAKHDTSAHAPDKTASAYQSAPPAQTNTIQSQISQQPRPITPPAPSPPPAPATPPEPPAPAPLKPL